MKRIITCLNILLIVLSVGCTNARRVAEIPAVIRSDKKIFQVPAGVDSAIAYDAKAKAERLFVVNPEKEQLADSLNKHFLDYLKITEDIYSLLEKRKEEFKKIRQEFIAAAAKNKGEQNLTLVEKRKYDKAFEQIAEDSLTISIVTSLLDYYLNYCYENFDRAYDLNPFDLNGLINIAACDWDRGLIFADTAGYRNSIKQLQKVLDHNKGAANVYRDIGNNYFNLKEWNKAHEYYSIAQRIFLITSYFDNPKPDSTEKHKQGNIPYYVDLKKYYDYLFKKGLAEIKIYEADSALKTFETTLIVAPSKSDSNYINKLVTQWIKWDDGNIYGAEQKAMINDSLKQGKFEWAKGAYIRLLPQLKTPKARDNITWELARIEISYLDQREQAAKRLYNMVINADTSKVKSNIAKAPLDSMYKVYFKDCGELLFDLGNKYRDQGLHDKARLYFRQDTTFDWAGRGKAFLPLAQLVKVPEDIQPHERLRIFNQQSIKLLNRAKLFIKDFSSREIDFLYRALIRIYRQQRDIKNAEENFREWQEFKNNPKKSSSTN